MSFLKQYAGSESTTTPCHRICYRTRGVSPRQAEILTALCSKLGAANHAVGLERVQMGGADELACRTGERERALLDLQRER